MTNLFFKPTRMYREYHILNSIDKNTAVTQRQLSDALETAVSLIHNDLEIIEREGYIKREHIHQTKVNYRLTRKGLERKRYLDLTYYHSSQKLYETAKENLTRFLKSLIQKGFKKVFLYGAGEVSSMMLTCIQEVKISLTILGIIDDDTDKHKDLLDVPIYPLDQALNLTHDGILIASVAYHDTMVKKLLDSNYDTQKIIRYFN
jgi:DNA-binding MarR family transcriptional regulator